MWDWLNCWYIYVLLWYDLSKGSYLRSVLGLIDAVFGPEVIGILSYEVVELVLCDFPAILTVVDLFEYDWSIILKNVIIFAIDLYSLIEAVEIFSIKVFFTDFL